ncbi:CheR family methyltransferase [Cryptosporangium sp. NPDC051539]|uniref:CheR family methyltransferase n=1 Tax=Cryptosporangium sp. NPDC051539 TaxID=3363962 RepID=UPI00378B8B9A
MTLSAHEFQFVSSLVRREASIVLEPGKEYLVEARLLPLARKAGLASVTEFLLRAQSPSGRGDRDGIVDALTTNETSWFRDREPFTALTELVIPQIVKSRGAQRTMRVWSAAASSGQEPYTLAILLKENLPPGWNYEIVGTDISTEMLARCERGRYSQLEVNRGLPAPLLVKHFTRVGPEWEVAAPIRKAVTFKRMNLAAPFPPMGQFDVVFCRNVLIYFDVETKRGVLKRIRSLLKPDGWLFLGAAETTMGIDDGFERVVTGRTSAYRPRTGTPAPVGAPGKG